MISFDIERAEGGMFINMFVDNGEFMAAFISLYSGALVTIVLSLFYGLYAVIIHAFSREETRELKGTQPTMTVIVPCFNEERIIVNKILNTALLNYPKNRLEVVFADGGSSDSTREVILKEIKKYSHMKLVETKQKGKIPQINEVLPTANGDIIVISDVDGVLDKSVLMAFAKRFVSPEIGAVGACVSPAGDLTEEQMYWQVQNYLRRIESRFYSPSIIIGVCYAFRKNLFSKYPDDVVADDIYVAFKTITKGLRVAYAGDAKVIEIRTPSTFKELIVHKSRKSNAYLKELFRFAGEFTGASVRWKIIFYNKLAQFTLVPMTMVWFIIAVFIDIARASIYQVLFVMLILLSAGTFLEVIGVLNVVKAVIISNLIIFVNLVRFPFYQQTSSYRKIK